MPDVATPTVDPNAAVLAVLASGQPAGATPFVDQPVAPSNGQATGKDVEVVKGPTPAQTPPAGEAAAIAAPVTETPVDPFVQALTGTSQGVEWTPEAKVMFKTSFGEDDPVVYRERIQRELAEKDELKQRVVAGDNISAALKRIEETDPAFAAAITEAISGRDPYAYISSIPNPKILGKSSKELSDETLADTYLREQFTDAERQARRTGDYSSLGVEKEVLDAKYKVLRPSAEFMHDQRNKEHQTNIQAREQHIAQERERDTQAVAAAIVHATNDPFAKLHVNQQSIEAFRNRSLFHGTFTQEDGALHPHSFTATIKAQRYDSDVKRALEAGIAIGKQSGLQEGTAQLPNARPGQRVIASQEEKKGDANTATIAAAIRS